MKIAGDEERRLAIEAGTVDQRFPNGGPWNPGIPRKSHKGSMFRPKKLNKTFVEKNHNQRWRC